VIFLRIKGVTSDGHAYIQAFISSPLLREKPAPIIFLIDLGATTTTILEGDCRRLGIDCSKLQKSQNSIIAAGGKIETYILPDVTLLFETDKGNYIIEKIEKIDVIKPRRDSILLPFSLLGVDILSRFKLVYTKDQVFLEK